MKLNDSKIPFSEKIGSGHVFPDIAALIFFSVLAPTLKLLAFNEEYFGISLIEAVTGVLIVSFLAGLPLIFMAAFAPLRRLVHTLAGFILIASVVTTFALPVSLNILEGGDSISLETRQEAWFFLLFMLLLWLFFWIAIQRIPQWRTKICTVFNGLTLLCVVYVGIFTIYTIFGVTLTGFTGTLPDQNATAPVSNDKNIFIISFDQVQGSFMQGWLNTFPEYKAIFDGFVFYPDAASTYPNTTYSISSMLLGRIVQNSKENSGYGILSQDSILATAKNAGFEIYNNGSHKNTIYDCVTCRFQKTGVFNWPKTYELLRHAVNLGFGADIASTGLVLLPGKLSGSNGVVSHFLIDHLWQLDLHEFDYVIEGLTTNSKKPVLYFMHFLGTHQPFIYCSDCTLKTEKQITESQNIDGAKATVACIINKISTFINRLQELSIYDNSMIFIVSDHGYELNMNLLYNEKNGSQYFPNTSSFVGDSQNIKPAGAYNPMFFFKDFYSRGNLLTDNTPVSLIDIAPTISQAIGCKGHWEGFCLQKKIPANRERWFWQYLGGGGQLRWETDGTDRFHDGLDVWWRQNSFKGPIYPNLSYSFGLANNQNNKRYLLGTLIEFHKDGNSQNYIIDGWSDAEAKFRWTEGHRASIRMRIQKPEGKDLLLRLTASPFTGTESRHQEIGVTVNDKIIAQWTLSGQTTLETIIPEDIIPADGSLELIFAVKYPTSPCDTSDSTDCRKLGMAVREMIIDEIYPSDKKP